jgi:GT2 family glycosyltransferase
MSAHAEPDLSVIVVTHQRGALAIEALETARAHLGEIDAEWLVVDSGSTECTPDMIEAEYDDHQVERLPNVGFAVANNRALQRARGRYALLLNPDMEVVSGTLAELVAAMDARPAVGAISVIQTWPDGRLQPTIRRFPSPARQFGEALQLRRLPGMHRFAEEEHREAKYGQELVADWLVGGFLLVRREAIAAIGGLDERFFMYSEETDWCYRLRSGGWEIRHFPVMTVIHHCGRMARPDLFAQSSHSKLLFAAKHFSLPRRLVFRGALILRHGIRLAMLAPGALVRASLRQRVVAERRALGIVLGLESPAFSAYSGPLTESPSR